MKIKQKGVKKESKLSLKKAVECIAPTDGRKKGRPFNFQINIIPFNF